MTPGDLTGVVIFLLLIAPGATFEFVWGQRRPLLRSTPFREANRVILVSVATWVPVVAIVLLLRASDSTFADDLFNFLRSGDASQHPRSAFLGLLLVVLHVAGAAFAALLLTRQSGTALAHATGWQLALRGLRPDGSVPYLWVTLKDGTCWGGRYRGADIRDIAVNERDLLIEAPLKIRHAGASETERVMQQLLVINGGEIRDFVVTYTSIDQGTSKSE